MQTIETDEDTGTKQHHAAAGEVVLLHDGSTIRAKKSSGVVSTGDISLTMVVGTADEIAAEIMRLGLTPLPMSDSQQSALKIARGLLAQAAVFKQAFDGADFTAVASMMAPEEVNLLRWFKTFLSPLEVA